MSGQGRCASSAGVAGTCWSSASSPGGPVCGGGSWAAGMAACPPAQPPAPPAGFSLENVLHVSCRLAPLATEGGPFPVPSLGLASPRTGPALAASAALRLDVCPAGDLTGAAPATTPAGACAALPAAFSPSPTWPLSWVTATLGTVPFQAGLCDAVRRASRPAPQRVPQAPGRPGSSGTPGPGRAAPFEPRSNQGRSKGAKPTGPMESLPANQTWRQLNFPSLQMSARIQWF